MNISEAQELHPSPALQWHPGYIYCANDALLFTSGSDKTCQLAVKCLKTSAKVGSSCVTHGNALQNFSSGPCLYPEKSGLIKTDKPQQDSSWEFSHMSLSWAFYSQIQTVSVSLSPFSNKCHFAAGCGSSSVMCAGLQFLPVDLGQCYKDGHVGLTKQSIHLHLMQPDRYLKR